MLTSEEITRITFRLEPIPPFRLDLTVLGLRRRADNVTDRWDGQTYRRVLVLADKSVEVAVTQIRPPHVPLLEVTVSGSSHLPDFRPAVTSALEKLLGVNVDLAEFYRFAAEDPVLHALIGRFRGLKPPRFPSMFECLVNAVACQQITLTLGIRLLNRLVETYGPPFTVNGTISHSFPRPEDLTCVEPDALRQLGFSGQKARVIVGLARGMAEGHLNLSGLEALDDEAAVARLRQIHGVGRWTAEYVLLRYLGRLHVFPGDDLGARNNLRRWLNLAGPLDYIGVQQSLGPWRNYGGLIYFHLLLYRLFSEGYIDEQTSA